MASAPDEMGAPLTFVCNFWKEFDLEGRRSQLDEVGMKVAQHQEDSVRNRKKLAKTTQEFRKGASEATVKSVGDLLKQYQQEVDRLTKRAKHSESAYLELYQKLYEAPDPVPSLSGALESGSRISELEARVRKQAQELEEFKTEAKEIKNQDLTIRKLEERIRTLMGEVQSQADELASAKQVVDRGREEELKEQEARLMTMLEESEFSLETMRKLHNASQNRIFLLQSETEEERAGYRSKLEIAVADIEQAQERVLTLETEKRRLLDTIETLKSETGKASGAGAGASDAVSDGLMAELAMQRNVVHQLRSELDETQAELAEIKESTVTRLDTMKDVLSAKESHVESLEAELASRPTPQQMDELKQQIRMLQSIQYSLPEGEEVEEADLSANAGSPGLMERMLLQKSRHLEHELTMAKLREVGLEKELTSTQGQNSDIQAQLEEQKDLVVKLEEDLLSAQSMPAGERSATGGGGESNGDEFILDGPSGQQQAGVDGSQTMVGVLQHQRDRFRRKADELREELSKCQMDAARSQAEAAASRADNVALVERIRFLQGYRKNNINQSDIEAGVDTERKYTKEYEGRMNPFTEFQSRQRENRKKQLGIVDKSVYIVGDLVFGNRYARLFVFFYVVVMHVLVMTTLVFTSHRHGGGHLLDVDEMARFCREHVQCGEGGKFNVTLNN
ncbi:hypothetical protein BSKO_04059 [Bryopsis sp. KO-2023]|nr:hypothetical protein BSKO_04059 [Bryopsis sp. KO-2023]